MPHSLFEFWVTLKLGHAATRQFKIVDADGIDAIEKLVHIGLLCNLA
jgi:hypothetical protein